MLVKYLLKKWPLLALYIVLAVAAPIVHVYTAYQSGILVDYVTNGESELFFKTLLVYMVYFWTHGILLFSIQAVRVKLVSICRRDLRQAMFDHIMSSNNTFFSKPDSGYYIAACTNDITILETRYFLAWMELIDAVLSLVTVIVGIVTLNTVLAGIIIIGYLFSFFICFLFHGFTIRKNKIYIDKLAHFTQRIKDYFMAFPMIRNYSVESQIKKRFNKMNIETEDAKDEADMSVAFVDRMGNMCLPLVKFFMVGYGIILILRGQLTMGLIFTAYQFSDNIVGSVSTISNNVNSIKSVRSIVERIRSIADASAEEKQRKTIHVDSPVTISLNDVSVNLDGNQILTGITHSFEPGKKYLIIGKNGAGKSSLLRLLKRSTEEYNGSVTINGHDIKDFSYPSLSGVISYINESVSLICATVRENILLYRDVPEEKLQSAVEQVRLKVDLDRVIRDGDRNISSGETRRIEIARSLIGEASVIIYDEAISTLDIPTAYEIEKTLLSLKEQTVLFVSHNFSSQLIEQYDEIILMDQGAITEYGTHKELMENSEYYQRIMKIKRGK